MGWLEEFHDAVARSEEHGRGGAPQVWARILRHELGVEGAVEAVLASSAPPAARQVALEELAHIAF